MKIEENISLLGRNTFGMDVKARVWAEYESVDELRELLTRYRDERIMHIGAGSNLLFTRDFDGVLLHSGMRRARMVTENDKQVLIEAGSGLVLDELIAQLCDMELGGMENLSYIPGEVGASAVQNVGAYGVEAKDVIECVNVLDAESLELLTLPVSECGYGYRESRFKHEWKNKYIVTSVVYRLDKTLRPRLDYGNLRSALEGDVTPMAIREAVIRIRKQKLPEVSELGSAGSFFMNPVVSVACYERLLQQYPDMPHYVVQGGVKIPAAWLIDTCGMKGHQLGGARVYDKQPLVIVNTGDAKPADIVALAAEVCRVVKEKMGVEIHPEVNYID